VELNEIVDRLRQAGHKVTPQRVVIIKTVIESTELLTPSALYERVRQVAPEVGEVTVYRTLNILSELGMVCVVHTGENTHSYISRPPEHHDHLICSECGKVVNFTDCNVFNLEKRLVSETGFTIQDHRLDIYGKCQECGHRVKRSRGEQSRLLPPTGRRESLGTPQTPIKK
jgi:Fur family ferric uptake transcriptional regulator